MRLPSSFCQWSIVLAVLALGCQPSIGDPCKLHTDCSATGNRLCEPNLPGGYCTIFNCEPDSCPSEAACVAFGVAPSTKPECAVTQQQRLERTFCMARCSSNSSCRGGYACVDLSATSNDDNPWGAVILDKDRGSQVCTVPVSGPALAATLVAQMSASDEVCSPPLDASFPPVPDSGVHRDAGLLPPVDARVRVDAARDAARRDAGTGAKDAQGGP